MRSGLVVATLLGAAAIARRAMEMSALTLIGLAPFAAWLGEAERRTARREARS
jgi:hypothetical protein